MRARDRFQRLIRDSDLPPLERSVLLELSWYMDLDTLCNAHPGHALIARRTGYTERSVVKALKSLERAGWIRKVGQGCKRGSFASANMYCGIWPPGVKHVHPTPKE